MTATLTPTSRTTALTDRLTSLRAERDQALAEIAPAGRGDDADRATNVDAHVRLEMLEQRIADIEIQLAEAGSREPSKDGSVRLGSLVTLDFGDGPETYLFGSVDQAGVGIDVITPGSPLGRALIGAKSGAAVTYEPRPRLQLKVNVLAVD